MQENTISISDLRSKDLSSLASSARCDRPVPWLGVCPGEKAVMGHPTTHQMSNLNPTETHWCERMQDMSGYVLPDLISQPLDEQYHFNYSTTHHENDFDINNPDNPSPEEVILEDQADAVGLEEDSDMFDNSNYSLLDTEIKTWLPSTSEIDEFVKTTADGKNADFLPTLDSENSLCVGAAKEDKKLSSTSTKSTYLSIFECEEPYIKEDPDTLSDCCTNSKLPYRDEMEVAAEEEVITEFEEDPLCNTKPSLDLNTLWRMSEFRQPIVPKVEVAENTKPFADELSSPLTCFSEIENCDRPFDIYSADQIGFLFDCNNEPLPTFAPVQRSMAPLRLDIEAAKMSSSQIFGETLPDTPEVLRPVLKPETAFDLVNFLLAPNDSNNNIPCSPSKKLGTTTRPQEQRRGKSLLSLQDLKASQTSRKRSLPETVVEDDQPSPTSTSDTVCDRLSLDTIPGPSSLLTSTGRPRRESATRFNKRLEQGYLTSRLDSNSVSSDDENSNQTIKSKRRRTLSSSNRSRLNSESDQSTVCDSSRYRERRDRNNVSSKKSRQKRKESLEMKTYELKDLEEENLRLKNKAAKLASVLEMVHKAWKEYLSSIQKEEPNGN